MRNISKEISDNFPLMKAPTYKEVSPYEGIHHEIYLVSVPLYEEISAYTVLEYSGRILDGHWGYL